MKSDTPSYHGYGFPPEIISPLEYRRLLGYFSSRCHWSWHHHKPQGDAEPCLSGYPGTEGRTGKLWSDVAMLARMYLLLINASKILTQKGIYPFDLPPRLVPRCISVIRC